MEEKTEIIKLEEDVWAAIEYLEADGCVMRSEPAINEPYTVSLHHIPFTLYPSQLSSRVYEKIIAIQPIINQLIHRASIDADFIADTLKDCICHDDFWSGFNFMLWYK